MKQLPVVVWQEGATGVCDPPVAYSVGYCPGVLGSNPARKSIRSSFATVGLIF